jgi:hypothetical protein
MSGSGPVLRVLAEAMVAGPAHGPRQRDPLNCTAQSPKDANRSPTNCVAVTGK